MHLHDAWVYIYIHDDDKSESIKSSQSSRLSVSSVESEDASEEEGPHDDDSVLVALGEQGILQKPSILCP